MIPGPAPCSRRTCSSEEGKGKEKKSLKCLTFDPSPYFRSHIIPVLLNLLESRDQHVRLTLLAHLGGYAPLCEEEELVSVVLREVLVGLKDSSDQVVGATLRALGDLVPLLGGDLVMGTSRRHIFTDAQPRVCVRGVLGSVHLKPTFLISL